MTYSLSKEKKPIHNIGGMVDAAWMLGMASLWNGRRFRETEITESRKMIRSIIAFSLDCFTAYIELCQRMLLYYHYTSEHKKLVIPSPVIWIRPGNGFTLSKIWYKSLLLKRTTVPLYRLELKGLAEAVLEMTEDGSDECFRYWVDWLTEKNAVTEISIFYQLAVITHSKKLPL